MADWAILSELRRLVEDINALSDASIAAAVALAVAWWRSRDDSKNRYSEEKLLAYERLISRLEILGEVELLCAEYEVLYQKRESCENLDAKITRAVAAPVSCASMGPPQIG